MDVLPDIHFRPVRDWKHADAFAWVDSRVIQVPKLRPLIFWIPLACTVAERVNALLRARLFFIAASATKSSVEVVMTKSIEQSLRLQQPAAALCIEDDRIGACRDRR